MKICFPARKKNGENYATLDEIMGLIGREPHGTWLAGTNKMWHGGIHLTEISAPGSVLKPDAMDSVVPVQCMADGEVVAWRLNQDYKTDTYNSQKLQYSTTFVLVKSVCKPDPEKENSWLEFYSLYMGLAPLSAFEKRKCMVAKKTVSKRKAGKYESSQQAGSVPHAPRATGLLAQGRRVLILEEATFLNKPVSPQARPGTTEAQPFGLAQEFDKDGKLKSEKFWVTLLPDYMAADGEQYAHLPVWMQKAVEKGTYDAVVKPATVLKISAGDAIGFLGEDVVPVGMGKISSSAYVHIEVLSTDSRMPAFLDNPGAVTSGRKYIRIRPGSRLYIKSGDTFTQTPAEVGKDIHAVLPEDKCPPEECGGKKYYRIGEGSWLSQDDVEALNQYDLKQRGFSAFVQDSTPDMLKSLTEKWVQSTFETYAEQVVPERGIQQRQMSDFYKAMAEKLDSDKDGELSGQELYSAVHHAELGIRDIAARMTVKHVSEWSGGSSDPKWTKFFETYDPLRIGFTKKWLDDMEWMSQVEPFSSGQAVWHMHPVVFLDALKQSKCDCESLYADKFKVTRYGHQYGPIYRGCIPLDKYPRWKELLDAGEITEDEKNILVAMSQNEGNMDAVQSYDSEVITAGAMQKTVKDSSGLEGKGELSAQIASFRDAHAELYHNYAANCGWTVEGSGASSILYYSDQSLTGGKKITATELKALIRNDCNKNTYGKVIHNKPLAALVKIITLPEYLDLQIIDFVRRLHKAEASYVGHGRRIKDYVKSNFGRALVLDESVNRPANVASDFKKAIENFHDHNPSIDYNPETWGHQHSSYELKLLDEYRLTRRMTDSTLRYNALKVKL
jgi:hypothetical protein